MSPLFKKLWAEIPGTSGSPNAPNPPQIYFYASNTDLHHYPFNGTLDDCGPSRFAEVAYEPGGGSTIMTYRGGFLPNGTYFPLCGAEELFSNDTYFHTASIEQIVNYTTFGSGSSCAVLTSTGNNPPNIDAGSDYTIP